MSQVWEDTYEMTWMMKGVINNKCAICLVLFIMIVILLAVRVNRSSMPFFGIRSLFEEFALICKSRTKVEMCTTNALDIYIFNIICVMIINFCVWKDGRQVFTPAWHRVIWHVVSACVSWLVSRSGLFNVRCCFFCRWLFWNDYCISWEVSMRICCFLGVW